MKMKHLVIDGFLGAEAAAALLDFAIGNEAGFEKAQVSQSANHSVDVDVRRAWQFGGSTKAALAALKSRIESRFGEICAALGVAPFELDRIELDLAAHRDGNFFVPHVDTFTQGNRDGSDRIVSAVYYLHRQPRLFTGGELALHAITGGVEETVAPLHDRLVAFPSFVPHEVRPTRVPGDAFGDARFSVNCWLHRKRG